GRTGMTAPAGSPESPRIRLRNLRKRFGRRSALAGIDLGIDGRQIVGVVGPDGAGKTTLLRAIAGLLDVEAEEATILGFDLRGDVTALKASVGYVPQAFGLQRDLSVMENLRFTARLHRLPEPTFRERAAELLERTGLAPFAGRQAGALSGGMKQKLAVSNALLPTPALLVLDEPTAGVDVVARDEIRDILERERSRAHVLLSTSYLDEAAACDRLVYLHQGRVVAIGTPSELRRSVRLRLYRLWCDDPRAASRELRGLPFVETVRAGGRFVRIGVRPDVDPARLRSALGSLGVRFVEPIEIDMESTLLALSRRPEETAGVRP
ncbi:MAG: ABC transporter ATP-binding protein, partial [Candidatus Binatia bacterium]